MNKSILLLFISILTFSCNTTQNPSPTQIGHEISDDDGSKVPLYAGSMSTIEVWENYITAHNNGDIEAVRNLNATENFKAIGPDGTVFDKPMKYQSKGICLQQIEVNTKNSSNMESYFKYICRPNDNIKKFKLSN